MKNMYRNQMSFGAIAAIASTILVSCGSKVVVVEKPVVETTHVVYSPGENLTALTKVHETSYKCDFPFGGNNGRNLFFVVYDNDAKNANIYRKDNPIGMSMSQLTGGNGWNTTPSYCSATNMVAFASQPNLTRPSDIYMVNATQGGALTQVTNTPDYEEAFPSMSSDGKRIVYEKRLRSADVKNTEIWVKNIQTNENTQLGLGCMPAFSPDGRSIVLVKYSPGSYDTYLCVVNADGGNVTQLTDASMGIVRNPCFSPDGNKIVFQCRKKEKEDFDLYIIDRNGNNLTQITMNKSYDGEPYWANDGNIYFTSDRGGKNGQYQIWRFKYQGKSPVVNMDNNRQSQQYGAYHTVSNGETITDIARRYGITVRDVVKWNNLTTMTITPGMKLKVSAQ